MLQAGLSYVAPARWPEGRLDECFLTLSGADSGPATGLSDGKEWLAGCFMLAVGSASEVCVHLLPHW